MSTIDNEDRLKNLELARDAAFRKASRMGREDADQLLADLRAMVETAKKLSPGSDELSEIVECFEYSVSPFEGGYSIEFDYRPTLSLKYDYSEMFNISELPDDAYPLWAEIEYLEGITIRLDELTRPIHALLCSIQRIVTSETRV